LYCRQKKVAFVALVVLAYRIRRWHGSVTFLEYLWGTAAHYVGGATNICKAAVGMRKATAPADEAAAESPEVDNSNDETQGADDNTFFSPVEMLKTINEGVSTLGNDMGDLAKHLKDTRKIAREIAAKQGSLPHPDDHFVLPGERVDDEHTLLARVDYLTELMGEVLNRIVDDDTAAERLMAAKGSALLSGGGGSGAGDGPSKSPDDV
jgi:hypothetical protein